jgi:hypothetical protein
VTNDRLSLTVQLVGLNTISCSSCPCAYHKGVRGGVKEQIHSFITFTTNGCTRPASRPRKGTGLGVSRTAGLLLLPGIEWRRLVSVKTDRKCEGCPKFQGQVNPSNDTPMRVKMTREKRRPILRALWKHNENQH